MSKTWKWILIGAGVFVVVFVIALFIITRFSGISMMGLGGRFHPMMRFPMMGGMRFFGGFRMIGFVLIPLVILGLAVAGVVSLVRRKPAAQQPVVEKPVVEVKNCGNCGKPVENGWVACPYCGNPLT
jgi:hypothetical protein